MDSVLQMEEWAPSSGVTRWNESETKHSSRWHADRQLEMNPSSFNLLPFHTCLTALLSVSVFVSLPLTFLIAAIQEDRRLICLCLFTRLSQSLSLITYLCLTSLLHTHYPFPFPVLTCCCLYLVSLSLVVIFINLSCSSESHSNKKCRLFFNILANYHVF